MCLQDEQLTLRQQAHDAQMQANQAREAAERHQRERLTASEHASAVEATLARLEGLQRAEEVHPVLLLPSWFWV